MKCYRQSERHRGNRKIRQTKSSGQVGRGVSKTSVLVWAGRGEGGCNLLQQQQQDAVGAERPASVHSWEGGRRDLLGGRGAPEVDRGYLHPHGWAQHNFLGWYTLDPQPGWLVLLLEAWVGTGLWHPLVATKTQITKM